MREASQPKNGRKRGKRGAFPERDRRRILELGQTAKVEKAKPPCLSGVPAPPSAFPPKRSFEPRKSA
eukprot:scaffold754_cov248-Pinguiococcus_pyrenoidosus.AAC.2